MWWQSGDEPERGSVRWARAAVLCWPTVRRGRGVYWGRSRRVRLVRRSGRAVLRPRRVRRRRLLCRHERRQPHLRRRRHAVQHQQPVLSGIELWRLRRARAGVLSESAVHGRGGALLEWDVRRVRRGWRGVLLRGFVRRGARLLARRVRPVRRCGAAVLQRQHLQQRVRLRTERHLRPVRRPRAAVLQRRLWQRAFVHG